MCFKHPFHFPHSPWEMLVSNLNDTGKKKTGKLIKICICTVPATLPTQDKIKSSDLGTPLSLGD